MAQQIANESVPVTSLSDFVDAVFSELHTKWDCYIDGYGCYDNPICWNKRLIPLAIRSFDLAQTDSTVYMWFLQKMSHVDICLDAKEDFRKSDLYRVLLRLKPEHSKLILENCVPQHAQELHKTLMDEDITSFRAKLPTNGIENNLDDIGRVLRRVQEIRDIYVHTLSQTTRDALEILFLLFKRYNGYFTNAYKHKRPCDGMAKNIFLALSRTQYSQDKSDFCNIADTIGNLWIRSLLLAFFKNNTQMPQTVSNLLHEILQDGNIVGFEGFKDGFENCDTEDQQNDFVKTWGGWLDFESYSFIYHDLRREYKRIRLPFSRKPNVKTTKRITNDIEQYYNCKSSELSTAIPLEELAKNGQSQSVRKPEKLATTKEEFHTIEPYKLPGEIHLYDGKYNNKPKTIQLNTEEKKAFLKKLTEILVSDNYILEDDRDNFIYFFSGEPKAIGKPLFINWKKTGVKLICLCCVLFDNAIFDEKKWYKISEFFQVKGKTVDTSNASRQKHDSNRAMMEGFVKKALELSND